MGEFLERHWQKAPLFLPQAVPGFTCPLSVDEVFRLAEREEVESRLVTHTQPSFERPYRLTEGPFARSALSRLGDRDWTLLVQDVDKLRPEMARLLEWIAFLPRWSVDDIMVSYAAPGGSVGPHTDRYDVFLLQGYGTRRWHLSHAANPEDLRTDTEMKVLRAFEGEVTYLARPGDVLYLPPGVAHYGVAEEPCLTLSFGFRAPTEATLVSAFCDEMVMAASQELIREKLSAPVVHPAEINSELVAHVRRVVEATRQALGRDVVFLGRALTEPKPNISSLDPETPASGIRRHLRSGGSVGRAPSSRFLFLEDEGSVHLFVDGEAHRLDAFSDPGGLAVVLCEASAFDGALLSACAGEGRDADLSELLDALIEAHSLVIVRAE